MASLTNSKDISTEIQSQKKKSDKVLCTKCVKAVPAYQFEFHYQTCQLIDQTEEFVYFFKEEKNHPFLCDLNIDRGDLPISGCYIMLYKEKMTQKKGIQLKLEVTEKSERIQKCCFCKQLMEQGTQVYCLPCKHKVCRKCLKKWPIISEPCRKCNL